MATPLFAAPDEPAHVVKAVAVWHEQLDGENRTVATGHIVTYFDLPEIWGRADDGIGCFAQRSDIAAGCAPPFEGPTAITEVGSTAGRYPPLYYAVVGWPSRLWPGAAGVYLMRLTGAVMAGVLLAAATRALAHIIDGRLALVGMLVAGTPMVYFLAGAVNPSGLEIASSAALLASAVAIVHTDRPPRWLLVQMGVSAVLMAFSRTLSPVLVLAVVALAGLTAPSLAIRRVTTDRGVLTTCGLVGLVAILSGVMVLRSGALTVIPGASVGHSRGPLAVLAGQTDLYLRQMIGIFGWLDSPAPTGVIHTWLGMVFVLAAAAIVLVPATRSMATLAAALATLVLPIVAQYPSIETTGVPWQGRYSLPLAMAVPILSTVVLGRAEVLDEPTIRRLCVLVGTLTGGATLAALFFDLRRNSTGLRGSFRILSGEWQPPGGHLLLLAAMLVFSLGCLASMILPLPRARSVERSTNRR